MSVSTSADGVPAVGGKETRRKQVKTYELEKIETYAIRASNLDEAIEILNGLDNSSAYKVEVRGIYASGGEGDK